ncbi:hypothetical protein Q5P01_001533 [Channa striata]|uniref:UBA domain-containing protein n=1 Tax=Channa striata TaxID=64152 RepID=A0AA88NMI5_CHASR|nr:hypothetical protein Q5P01_001533 [Channa striata]
MSSSTSPSQSPSSSQPQTLDRSQSAPAAMEQALALGQCQDQPGFQELPWPLSEAEDTGATAHQVHPHPLPVHSISKVPPESCPKTDVLPACTPPADLTSPSQYPEGVVLSGATEGDSESFEAVNSSMLLNTEELSPTQPMEQETTESVTEDTTGVRPSAPSQPDSVEMESPVASNDVVTSERDQPEGEHCSSSDIPSLAAALMELHELLVSNNCAHSQNRSTSCSPSHPFGQDTEEVVPEPCTLSPKNTQSAPSTAITAGAEPSDAKANHAAAVSDEGPAMCLVPDLYGHIEHLGGDTAKTVEAQGPPQHPEGSGERRTNGCGQDEASNSIPQPEPEVPPDPAGDLEFREPPEGQQGRGVADGRDSGTNTPDTVGFQTEHTFLSPLSLAVGSPEEASCTSPSSVPPLAQAPQPASPAPLLTSPHPFIEQFPAEHIQRIQAAGFSAREAAEALEQAHGVVELALLALLARSITVPT